MNTSDPHQIEKKELFSPTISDEQICAKFREGENIYNIVNWYSMGHRTKRISLDSSCLG